MVCNLGLLRYNFLQTIAITISPDIKERSSLSLSFPWQNHVYCYTRNTLWYDNGGGGRRISSQLRIIMRTPHSCEIWYSVILCPKVFGSICMVKGFSYTWNLDWHISLEICQQRMSNLWSVVHFRVSRNDDLKQRTTHRRKIWHTWTKICLSLAVNKQMCGKILIFFPFISLLLPAFLSWSRVLRHIKCCNRYCQAFQIHHLKDEWNEPWCRFKIR